MKSFCTECVQLGSDARNKVEVLEEIARLAKKTDLLARFREEQIFTALQEREKIGSTGFGNGIAIPHCTLEGLKEFIIGFLVIPSGFDFQALDGQKTTVLFFIPPPGSRKPGKDRGS